MTRNDLKKKDVVSTNVISSNKKRNCDCCGEVIKCKEQIWSFEFFSFSKRIYLHFRCRSQFETNLK